MNEITFNELRDNLGKILGLDFTDIETGHNKIENRICDNVNFDELTKDQWEAILSRDYEILFQDGIPHVSWNTDRSAICHRISRDYEPYTGDHWDETWYHVSVAYYKFSSGVCIKCKVEEPIVWTGGSRSRYNISLIPEDEVPAKNTHTAVILAVDNKYGKAYIVEQFTGPYDEVNDWLLEKGKKYGKSCVTKVIQFA